MKIVIDIPEDVYKKTVFYREFKDLSDCITTIKALENGKSLPKGHGDLIDKEKFKRWIETQDGDKLMTEYYLDALDMQEKVVGGSCDEDID